MKYQAAARFFTLRDVTSRVLGVHARNFTGALPECIRIDIIRQNLHSRSMVFAVKESQNFRGGPLRPAVSVAENGDIAACPRAKVGFGEHKIVQLRK